MTDAGPLYLAATTMSLAGIVACQVGNAFACLSSRQSVWQLGLASNRLLLAGIAGELLLLLSLIYIRPLQAVFGLSPPGLSGWVMLSLFAPLLIVFEEIRKAISRRLTP
jgi:magnesium-transporting ATPase (P-type)